MGLGVVLGSAAKDPTKTALIDKDTHKRDHSSLNNSRLTLSDPSAGIMRGRQPPCPFDPFQEKWTNGFRASGDQGSFGPSILL